MSEQHSVMPAIFIGHGSPGNILEDNPATRMWESLASEFDRPKGIVCVSAHWYIKGTAVTANEQPRTIHDFGGFPQIMYEMQYPAPGSQELANHIVALLEEEDARLKDLAKGRGRLEGEAPLQVQGRANDGGQWLTVDAITASLTPVHAAPSKSKSQNK